MRIWARVLFCACSSRSRVNPRHSPWGWRQHLMTTRCNNTLRMCGALCLLWWCSDWDGRGGSSGLLFFAAHKQGAQADHWPGAPQRRTAQVLQARGPLLAPFARCVRTSLKDMVQLYSTVHSSTSQNCTEHHSTGQHSNSMVTV